KLPIEKFFGVGKVTAKKMHLKGIFRGKDLKKKTEDQLTRWFGKSGKYYYNIVRGIDNRAVNPNRIRKSLGAERTYEKDITTKEEMLINIELIAEILIKRIKNSGGAGKSLTLKVKYGDFKQITRSKTLIDILSEEQIKHLAIQLLDVIPDIEKGIRLIGLQTANFEQESKDTFLGQLEFEF
ncbi:MAG: DNA polymerase thumb domain-containing protein, partial [Vicingaceae bacterium]